VSDPDIVVLDGGAAEAALDELAAVLEDCVAGGASVNFMPPFPREAAATFFRGVVKDVARGDIVLLAARDGGRIVGTVQLGLAMPPNQPHRADVKKLLVHRSGRERGVGAALMRQVENEAKSRGRMLLVLDTCSPRTAPEVPPPAHDAAQASSAVPGVPRVLVVDISGEEQPLSALSELAHVVEPDVCVLVVGALSCMPVRGLGSVVEQLMLG
jgi:GNAT superfamily N-acetyltransferase